MSETLSEQASSAKSVADLMRGLRQLQQEVAAARDRVQVMVRALRHGTRRAAQAAGDPARIVPSRTRG